jgi:hypothetical protein
MQTKPVPTEGQNSAKLEAESALRGAACCASSFEDVVLAIDELLALLYEADMQGCKVYGKMIMETGTWIGAIRSLDKAELLSGQRGQVACRKMKEVISGVPSSRLGSDNAKQCSARTDDLLGIRGSLKVKSPKSVLESVENHDECSNRPKVVGRVRLHQLVNALKKPFSGMCGVIHNFRHNAIAQPPAGDTPETSTPQ